MQSEIIRQIVRQEVRKKIKNQQQLVEHRKNVRACVKFLDLVIVEQSDRALIKEFAGLNDLTSGVSTFISGFFDNIPEGGKNLVYETVTGFILDSIANALGIPEISTDTLFGSFLRNFIPEFAERGGIDTITRFVATKDPSACKELVEAVFVGFIETGGEKIFYDKILPEMFSSVTKVLFDAPIPLDAGPLPMILRGVGRETINEFMEQYLKSMINPVSDFLCVHQDAEKFKDEIMGMMNLNAPSDVKGALDTKTVKGSGVKKYSDEDLINMLNKGSV